MVSAIAKCICRRCAFLVGSVHERELFLAELSRNINNMIFL